ncbi:SMI1/KNR4 family protein [Aeromonas salmonicida]|uniref:SMI1/KNR4 family protein n=1 Tax=Aeromonas salmonicida TaxID=645 RepID=UPI0022404A3C|nr:SMI1/KNR4 family protein [Aeromonas salmonicida]
MTIEKQDLVNWAWENKDVSSNADEVKIQSAINHIERELSINLPNEYKDFIFLTGDQGAWFHDRKNDFFLTKYSHKTMIVMMNVFFPTELATDYTKLLQESIYDHRTLLPNGLIVIASDCDDDADAYLIYDVREESATYQHIFHWRYYVDNLVVGDGLGFVARSLKEFLHMPTSEDNL